MATNFLLVNVFTAFLPRRDPDEGDFYEALGLAGSSSSSSSSNEESSGTAAMAAFFPGGGNKAAARSNVTPEEIRKAYKAKSLQLHPDKVAQRGEDAEAAARQYERVQEAYACLNDPKNREQYHQLKCSPTYYRFVVTNPGGFLHPMALYENLQNATFVDKTRLVVLVTLFLMLSLLQPILVAAKVNQTLAGTGSLSDAPWVAILTPLWIGHGLFLLMLVALSGLTRQVMVVATLLEHACWLAGEVLLAQQWDRAGSASAPANWHVISVPFYFALALRVVASVLVVLDMIHNQMKMVSPDKLRADHPDWTDEQFMAAEDEYCIVTVDEEAVAHTVQLLTVTEESPVTEEDLELIRVQLSPEYQASSAILKDQSKAVMYILVFGFTFVALVAAKLENQIYVSWWTVFVPIWVYLGQSILYYLLVCCCLSTGDSVLVVRRPQDEEEGGEDQEPDNEATTASSPRPVPSSSANFASVEGSMKEFNEESASGTAKTEVNRHIASEGTSSGTQPTETTSGSDAVKTSMPSPHAPLNAATSSAEISETAKDPATAAVETPSSTDPAPPASSPEVKDVEEEENMPQLDEDTFRAWQHAQEKAESSAMEKEAKASSACCFALFQLMIVCLVVGKLQDDYQQPDPSGYNAFWVLFPIFLVVGVVLCCCACLIYGPAYEVKEPGDDDADPPTADVESGQGEAVFVPLTPLPTTQPTSDNTIVPPAAPAVQESPATTDPLPTDNSTDGLPQGGGNENDAAPSDEGGSNRAPSDEAIDMNDLD